MLEGTDLGLPILAGLLIGLAAVLWFALPWVDRQRRTARLAACCAARRAIVLSYDDGPGARVTPDLLDLLGRHGAKASFFVIGRVAEARPDLIARLLAEGHEIGNHTQEHLNAWKVWPWRAPQDLRAGRKTLDRLGIPAGSFRPPYGKVTLASWLAAWLSGQMLAFWTLDTRDSWEHPRPIAEVLARLEAQGGGVVLMHDCDDPPRAGPGHGTHIQAMTMAILDLAGRKGFALLRFCDLQGENPNTPAELTPCLHPSASLPSPRPAGTGCS